MFLIQVVETREGHSLPRDAFAPLYDTGIGDFYVLWHKQGKDIQITSPDGTNDEQLHAFLVAVSGGSSKQRDMAKNFARRQLGARIIGLQ